MPDYILEVPRQFTDIQAGRLEAKGARLTVAGGEPVVVATIPGRTLYVTVDDKDAAIAFVMDETDFRPDEVKVIWPPDAAD